MVTGPALATRSTGSLGPGYTCLRVTGSDGNEAIFPFGVDHYSSLSRRTRALSFFFFWVRPPSSTFSFEGGPRNDIRGTRKNPSSVRCCEAKPHKSDVKFYGSFFKVPHFFHLCQNWQSTRSLAHFIAIIITLRGKVVERVTMMMIHGEKCMKLLYIDRGSLLVIYFFRAFVIIKSNSLHI